MKPGSVLPLEGGRWSKRFLVPGYFVSMEGNATLGFGTPCWSRTHCKYRQSQMCGRCPALGNPQLHGGGGLSGSRDITIQNGKKFWELGHSLSWAHARTSTPPPHTYTHPHAGIEKRKCRSNVNMALSETQVRGRETAQQVRVLVAKLDDLVPGRLKKTSQQRGFSASACTVHTCHPTTHHT